MTREGFDYPVPVAVLDGTALADSGFTVLGDALSSLPQALAATGLQSTSNTLFDAGQSRVDLRALGPTRTLVLVDGQRYLAGDFRTPAVDLNMIPASMIERVEAISGGASAIYGSEAIAGVVNVILKNELDGLEVDVQGGLTSEDDGEEWKIAAAWGMDFASERGNLLLGAEIGRVEPVFRRDRDWAFPGLRRNNLVSPQTTIANSRSNVLPTATFQLRGGSDPATAQSVSIALDRSALNVNTAECRTTNVRPTCQDPWLFYVPTYDVLQGNLERETARAYLDFDVTERLEAFADVSYGRADSVASSQPAFTTPGGGGMPVRLRGDNAFLNGTSALAAALRTEWTAAGLPLTQAGAANIGKFWEEFGTRDSRIFREFYRVVSGVRGGFAMGSHDFTYDAYAQFGELDGFAHAMNVPNVGRVVQATDAVSVGGQVVCRDPAAQAEGCVPWNLIDQPSTAAISWANASARSDGVARQTVGAVNVSTSLFDLPAGAVGLAAGIEHRKEEVEHTQDALSASGALFYNAFGATSGEYDLSEAYAEVVVPLLKEKPLAHRLSLEMAGRLGDYSTVGSVNQWRLAADWAPIEELRLRASSAAAVRAPNITELFAPQGRNFTNGASDPCDFAQVAAIPASETERRAARIANCTVVIPGYDSSTFASTFGPGRPSLPLLQGGNPDLQEEQADTFTAGIVFQPHWASIQLSVDYWSIEVDGAISTIPINTLLQNLCYDVAQEPAHSNRFCALVRRDPTGATSGTPGGVIEVVVTNQNVQSIETSGVDVALSYDQAVGDLGRVSFRANGTKIDKWQLRGVPGGPVTEFAGFLTGATPEYKVNATVGWQRGGFAASWQTHWLSSMGISETDPPASRDPFYTGNYWEHDLRATFAVSEALKLRAGVINVTDEIPPQLPEAATATGLATSSYDNRGRWFYVGGSYSF